MRCADCATARTPASRRPCTSLSTATWRWERWSPSSRASYLASDPELLQFGKHPGKTNLTDADNALNILRYLDDTPCAVIVKHNNPCGVAKGPTLAEAYFRANKADRLAAFGGCIALNRECDLETARLMARTTPRWWWRRNSRRV
jgi:hypothetical protein